MAKIHQHNIKLTEDITDKLKVCLKLTGRSKSKLVELFVDRTYQALKTSCPQKVEAVEKELKNAA